MTLSFCRVRRGGHFQTLCKWDHCFVEGDLSARYFFIDYETEKTN